MGPDTLVLQGRFQVLRHIGGGGMAEVYLAVQRSLGRQVALKVLKRDLGKRADMAERFRREALLLSTVDHPAVVRVIDFERTADATMLVLELAEGDTLETVLREGPISAARAIPILTQLAEGLCAIHEKGIIHRDLKPQNVVVTPTSRGEQARLLDFGIARLVEMGTEEPSALNPDLSPLISQVGQVVGTPAFVAPEQAMGKMLDVRSDVYSFGILAYRMLTGTFPFPGPSSVDFLKQHVLMAPMPIEQAAPALSEQSPISKLVMQCLEKNPDQRPQSAEELYQRLFTLWPQGVPHVLTTHARRRATQGFSIRPWRAWLSRFTELSNQSTTHARMLGRELKDTFAKVPSRWKKSVATVLAIPLIVLLALTFLPSSPEGKIIRNLEQHNPTAALELIEKRRLNATHNLPLLLGLKAVALHQLEREDEERQLLRQTPYQALMPAHPLVLDALAEDFGRAEDDAELASLIQVVPAEILTKHFDERSRESKGSERQWGALRWADLNQKVTDSALLSERYMTSLTADSCHIRGASAHRLASLKAREAIEELRALSETPKEIADDQLINCGQDEAAEAIRELKRP